MHIYISGRCVYVKRRFKKKRIKKVFLVFSVVLTITVCIFFGDCNQKDSLLETTLGQAKSELYLKMLNAVVPTLSYEKEEMSSMEYLIDRIFQVIPVYGYITETTEYETQSESNISYEDVIANEASDENYVDENPRKLLTEGEEKITTTEEEMQIENKQEKEGVSAFVPNQTPVVSYPKEKLNDFDYLIQNFYVVDRTTTINSSQLNAADLLSRNMKLTHGADAPQILIYHTHSQEYFADSIPKDSSTSIVAVGEYLHKLLGEYGFHVLHHKGEYDVESRDDAYAKAGPAIEQILKENPSIEVVIDLHRDGVSEGTHLVTEVQGKQTASIMFFNGLSRTTANGDIAYLPNPYIQDNLAFSLQMQVVAEEYYPEFSRAIYLKGYRYNMHYCPKTALVEVGAQTNTLQEAMNAMEPLADIIAKVIGE